MQELTNAERSQRAVLDPISARYLIKINDPRERKKSDERMKKLSEKIEREILGGSVRVEKNEVRGISYKFMQAGAKRELELSKASSMVSDLSPLVVYIRNALVPGDTLIIEEPESHLHPRMQEKIADCIALLVKSGVRVIMTTHSEWITDRISYLALLSDLGEKGKKFGGYDCAISESDIGIWEFKRASETDGSIVKKIEFDHGMYKLDYSTFALQAFNQHDLLYATREDQKNDKL